MPSAYAPFAATPYVHDQSSAASSAAAVVVVDVVPHLRRPVVAGVHAAYSGPHAWWQKIGTAAVGPCWARVRQAVEVVPCRRVRFVGVRRPWLDSWW